MPQADFRLTKKLLAALAAVALPIIGSFVAMLATMSFQELLLCAAEPSSSRLPRPLCELTLNRFRGGSADREALEAGAGLSFVAEIDAPGFRERTIPMLVARGYDINQASHVDGLTPLHGAVLHNDLALAQLLIENGADPDALDARQQHTPYQYAIAIEQARPGAPASDRAAMKALLMRAGATVPGVPPAGAESESAGTAPGP